MDNADIANDLVQERMDRALAARQPAKGASVEVCEDCGDLIPLARRQALIGTGCQRCVECQQLHERLGGGR